MKRTMMFGCVVGLVMLLLGVVWLYERRIARMQDYWRQVQESEELDLVRTMPEIPVGYLSRRWRAKYGAAEPDAESPQGKAIMKEEEGRLPAARAEFRRMLEELPQCFIADDDSGLKTFLLNTKNLLDQFTCHEIRGWILVDVKWHSDGWGKLSPPMDLITNDLQAERAVQRCYLVRGTLADWLWEKGGDEYAAAQSDYRTLLMLRNYDRLFKKKGWSNSQKAIGDLMEDWCRCRCDSEDSNFHRAHEYCEEMYQICFEPRVKKYGKQVLKVWDDHYRFHLSIARTVLKREPKWGPEYH